MSMKTLQGSGRRGVPNLSYDSELGDESKFGGVALPIHLDDNRIERQDAPNLA